MKEASGQFTFENVLTREQLHYFDRHGIIQFKAFVDKGAVAGFLREIREVENYFFK